MQRVVAALVLGAIGCGGGSGSPPDGRTIDAGASAAAVYAPPTPGAGGPWGAVPFPNDLYLDADGMLTLTSLPVGAGTDPEAVDLMLAGLRELDGSGVYPVVFFPVTGAIDAASLDGNVVFIDVDGGGTPIETDLVFRADVGMIACAPIWGTVLRRQHRYGAYLLDGVRGTDGLPLTTPAAFAAARDLDATPADPAVAAAQASIRPLLEGLPEGTRARVVSAAVFVTENVARDTLAMRDYIHANPPAATFVDLVGPADGELAAVMGNPTQPYRGGDIPGGVQRDDIGVIVQGTLGMTSFLGATPNVPGLPTYDGDGDPEPKGVHPVAFTLVLPAGLSSYADIPVVIVQHGVNDSRMTMLVFSDVLAERGIATLGIDLPYHASRYPTPMDLRNDLLNIEQPDGFADEVGLFAAAAFFQLFEQGGFAIMHPGVQRENLRAAALDLVSLVTWVRQAGAAAPLASNLPSPYDTLSFRTDRVGLHARSFGSMIAGLTVAIEPGITAASLFVPAAGFPFPTLVHSGEYGPTFSPAITGRYNIADRVILGDPVQTPRFDPMFVIYDMVLERGDPLAYAPYVLAGEIRGDTGPNLLMAEAYSDEDVPNDATESFAAALGLPRGLITLPESPPTPGLRHVTLPELDAPIAGNLGGGQRTAGLVLWYPSTHGVGAWRNGESNLEPGFPPFVNRETQLPIMNFTDEAQELLATFLAESFGGAAPTIIDPF